MLRQCGRADVSARVAHSEFVNRVRAALGEQLIEVRLFGSKARGDAGPDSDLDILLVVDAPSRWPVSKTISKIAFDVNLAYDVRISPVVLTSGELRMPRNPRLRESRANC